MPQPPVLTSLLRTPERVAAWREPSRLRGVPWHGWRLVGWCGLVALLLLTRVATADDVGPGVQQRIRAEVVADPGGLTPPSDQAPWQNFPLPHVWQRTHPGHEGTMWYRFTVPLAAVPTQPWAVFIPRVVSNAQVFINGLPMAYTGSMTKPVTRNWYVPLMTAVQPNMLRQGVNVVHIRVATGFVARAGLSPVYIGPLDQLTRPYTQRLWAQIDGAYIANVGLVALGAIMLIVWARDRELASLGFMGLASVVWGLSVLANLAPNPWFEAVLWENVTYVLTVVACLLLALFCFRFTGPPRRWRDALMVGLTVALPAYGVWASNRDINVLIYLTAYLISVWAMVEAIWRLWRAGRPDGAWMVAGCLVVLPAGAHDIMIMTGALPFETVYWIYFAVPILMGCVSVIVAGDYARSRRALSELNRTLVDRVNERERALRDSFERLGALERAQAVSQERSRILKDMHDGVGTHLTSALRQLQGRSDSVVDVAMVTQTLRDSLDQLKLSIDALSLVPGDVAGLLASWRFRLAPRLKAAGIELVWDVDPLPPWPDGQSPALRHVQYILFEGLSNVLQHTRATRLVLSARDVGSHLRISLIDNGTGWEQPGGIEGQGLQTMRSRAQAIGADMGFIPATNGGLELRLNLPMKGQMQTAVNADNFDRPSTA